MAQENHPEGPYRIGPEHPVRGQGVDRQRARSGISLVPPTPLPAAGANKLHQGLGEAAVKPQHGSTLLHVAEAAAATVVVGTGVAAEVARDGQDVTTAKNWISGLVSGLFNRTDSSPATTTGNEGQKNVNVQVTYDNPNFQKSLDAARAMTPAQLDAQHPFTNLLIPNPHDPNGGYYEGTKYIVAGSEKGTLTDNRLQLIAASNVTITENGQNPIRKVAILWRMQGPNNTQIYWEDLRDINSTITLGVPEVRNARDVAGFTDAGTSNKGVPFKLNVENLVTILNGQTFDPNAKQTPTSQNSDNFSGHISLKPGDYFNVIFDQLGTPESKIPMQLFINTYIDTGSIDQARTALQKAFGDNAPIIFTTSDTDDYIRTQLLRGANNSDYMSSVAQFYDLRDTQNIHPDASGEGKVVSTIYPGHSVLDGGEIYINNNRYNVDYPI